MKAAAQNPIMTVLSPRDSLGAMQQQRQASSGREHVSNLCSTGQEQASELQAA